MKQKYILSFLATAVALFSVPLASVQAADTRSIIFPVLGGAAYSDDFGAPRSGGRIHEGNDLMGKKMQPLVAATDGYISYITSTEASWGYSLSITDEDGYEYNYLHLNNDSPGTDDGKGGNTNAFAPGIKSGARVTAGEVVGYLGDSGNAETTAPHLHFEIRKNNTPLNPYQSLKAAKVIFDPVERSTRSTRTRAVSGEFFPYQEFEGGATIASANLDKDSKLELVTGTAFNGNGRTIIYVYDTTGKELQKFFAYGELFRGGVDVATADIDKDGVAEIITGAGPGGGPHVKVFKANGTLVSEFMAYGSGFLGGVHVSAADIDGDGQVEIVTGPGSGGGPHIKVFSTTGTMKHEFFAYDGTFTSGVDVAAFGMSGKTAGGIATAGGAGTPSTVKVFSMQGVQAAEFTPYDKGFAGGMRVTAGDTLKSKAGVEIGVVPASNNGPILKIYSTAGKLLETDTSAGFSRSDKGGYDITFSGSDAYIATAGGRKTSVRKVK